MRSGFMTFYRAYGRLLTGIAMLAGVALFALMWLVNTNALTRKLFNFPITGTLEITEAAMPIIIMLPMAYTQMQRGHIRVTMISDLMGPQVRRVLLLAALAIGCAFTAWVAWATFGYASRSLRIGESAWGVIRFPIWPSKMSIALGAGLLSFQFLLDLIKVGFVEDDPPDDHGHAAPVDEGAYHG
jgi:TRAP-type C4-dicarboxylate transport system permease small subunit